MPKQLLSHIKNFSAFSAKISLIFLFLFSATETFSQNIDLPALSPKLIAQKTLPSIVILVLNNGDNLPITTGSGFFVTEDTIVTNYHVIKNAKLGAFKIYGSDEVYSVLGTVGVDAQHDLALLKAKGVKGKPLKMNRTYQISIGDEVFTVSSPKGLEGSFSQGLVSGLRKTSEKDLIQITAPISHGSSGGAILNNQAEVIAVAVGGIDEGQSLNFAVPVKYVQSLIAKRSSLADLPGKNSFPLSSTLSSSGRTGGQGSNQGIDLPTKQKGNIDLGIKDSNTAIESLSLKAPSAFLGIIKSRIPPPPPLKTNQFKVPDLINEDLRGDVFGTLTTTYKVVPNYNNLKKDGMTFQNITFYNREGNIIDIKEIDGSISADYGLKYVYTYDSTNRTVTMKTSIDEDNDIPRKLITFYDSVGEVKLINDFKEDGALDSKTNIEKTNQFVKTTECYADNSCNTTFVGLDKNENHVEIEYVDGNLLSMKRSETKDNLVVGSIEYDFCHGQKGEDKHFRKICNYNGKPAKITVQINSYDTRTREPISIDIQIQDLDNPEKSETNSYKYEYRYDLKGNWIEKVEKEKVTKYGEAYFEPISSTERKIKYYSDPDTKPSVNKKPPVKRKKN